jgi:uncharacterized protein DUF3450
VIILSLGVAVAEARGQEASARRQEARQLRERLIEATRALEEERVAAAAQRRAREARRRELETGVGRLREERAEFERRAREFTERRTRVAKELAEAERRRAGMKAALEKLAQRGRRALESLRQRQAKTPPGGSPDTLNLSGLDARLADPLDTRRLQGLRDLLSLLGEDLRQGSLVRLEAREITVDDRHPQAYVLSLGHAQALYRREDGEESGWWDTSHARWRPFSKSDAAQLQTIELIETARGRLAPGLRPCPLPAISDGKK